jgi:hypothetical protein
MNYLEVIRRFERHAVSVSPLFFVSLRSSLNVFHIINNLIRAFINQEKWCVMAYHKHKLLCNICYAIARVLRLDNSDCLCNLTPGWLVYYSWRNLLLASLDYSAVNTEVAGSSGYSDLLSQCTQYCLLCIGVSFVLSDVFQRNPWADAANLQNLPQTVKESIDSCWHRIYFLSFYLFKHL